MFENGLIYRVRALYYLDMKHIPLLLLSALLLPNLAYADSLQEIFTKIPIFLSNVVIPFILGLAFLFFAFGVIRFFVAGAGNEEGQKKAKSLAIYSIFAFVVILVFWGVVNMLASSFGFSGKNAPVSDYIDPDGTQSTNRASNSNKTTQDESTDFIGDTIKNSQQESATPDPVVYCNVQNPDGSVSTPRSLRSACVANGGTPTEGDASNGIYMDPNKSSDSSKTDDSNNSQSFDPVTGRAISN